MLRIIVCYTFSTIVGWVSLTMAQETSTEGSAAIGDVSGTGSTSSDGGRTKPFDRTEFLERLKRVEACNKSPSATSQDASSCPPPFTIEHRPEGTLKVLVPEDKVLVPKNGLVEWSEPSMGGLSKPSIKEFTK